MISPRNHTDSGHGCSHKLGTCKPDVKFFNPSVQLNVGLWTLFAGATLFLALRIWIKITRRHGLWWDDHILLVSWAILAANNSIISIEYATGYVAKTWDDRMHILINVTSCGTLVGQALTKTAFAVTLLKLTNGWLRWALWYCIASMNTYMVVKVFFQWARICNKRSSDVWYLPDFCLNENFSNDFKVGGNVYNVIMDFVLATFPWIITWNLDMRKVEKIGLCITMSLGMVVAIVAAVRIDWKGHLQDTKYKDAHYFVRGTHSTIWYSSEIVGTIIVQCIPVMRPLLRDLHTSISRRYGSSGNNSARRSRLPPGFKLRSLNEVTDSDAADTYPNTTSKPHPDSWDNEGMYLSKDVEMATIKTNSPKEDFYV